MERVGWEGEWERERGREQRASERGHALVLERIEEPDAHRRRCMQPSAWLVASAGPPGVCGCRQCEGLLRTGKRSACLGTDEVVVDVCRVQVLNAVEAETSHHRLDRARESIRVYWDLTQDGHNVSSRGVLVWKGPHPCGIALRGGPVSFPALIEGR